MPVPELPTPQHPGAHTIAPVLPAERRLAMPPNHPFRYVFYAGRLRGALFIATIEAGDGVPDDDVGTWWLPVMTRHALQPGLNGFKLRRNGVPEEDRYDLADRIIRKEGGIIVDPALGYCVAAPCRDPRNGAEGLYYHEPWSSFRNTRPGELRTKVVFDRQKYARWLLNSIVRAGVLGDQWPPDPEMTDYRGAQIASALKRCEEEAPRAISQDSLAEAQARSEAFHRAKVPTRNPNV